MCEILQELKFAEKSARGLRAKSELNGDEATLYAQWELDAQRVQRSHMEMCPACLAAHPERIEVGR
jgi:hypothetical protein